MMILVWSYQYKIMVKCFNVFNLDFDVVFISKIGGRKWMVQGGIKMYGQIGIRDGQLKMNGKENIFNLDENGTIFIFYNFIFLLVLIIWTLGLSDFGGWSIRRVKSGADINILRNFNDVMFPRMDIPN